MSRASIDRVVKGADSADKIREYELALEQALAAGGRALEDGGSALDAVQLSVVELEDCPLFNAGKGSVYTAEGQHELDAAIMDGSNLEAGAVAQLRGIKNPVRLARAVMEQSEHVFLAADGAMQFARTLNHPLQDASYFAVPERYRQWQDARQGQATPEKFGTVGAVARDRQGNLAAATSTGGILNKRFGRIGDSPLIGAGTYANNNTCAVSCTGSGEFFIRAVAAYDLACLMEHAQLSLEEAARRVVHERLVEIRGDGGLIAIDTRGNIAMPFNTQRMFRACVSSDTDPIIRS